MDQVLACFDGDAEKTRLFADLTTALAAAWGRVDVTLIPGREGEKPLISLSRGPSIFSGLAGCQACTL
jgi:hypothetical protein